MKWFQKFLKKKKIYQCQLFSIEFCYYYCHFKWKLCMILSKFQLLSPLSCVLLKLHKYSFLFKIVMRPVWKLLYPNKSTYCSEKFHLKIFVSCYFKKVVYFSYMSLNENNYYISFFHLWILFFYHKNVLFFIKCNKNVIVNVLL